MNALSKRAYRLEPRDFAPGIDEARQAQHSRVISCEESTKALSSAIAGQSAGHIILPVPEAPF